jgi:branched-chain amino acid transport system substrate-binding protein
MKSRLDLYGLIGAATAAALLSSACSSASKAAANSPATTSGSGSITTTVTTVPTGTPIVIGANNSDSGIPGTSPVPGQALQAWVNWTNSHGGIAGHPVKLYMTDDQGNPTNALANVKDLVENKHIVALVGSYDFAVEKVYYDYLAQKGVPLLDALSTTQNYLTSPDLFPIGTTPDAAVSAPVAVAVAKGVQGAVGYVACTEIPGCLQAVPVFQSIAKQEGLVPFTKAVSQTAPSYTAECIAAQQANVKVLFPLPGSTKFIDDCAQQGYSPQYVGTDYVYKQVAQYLQDPAAVGMTLAEGVFPADKSLPQTADFFAAMEASGIPDANIDQAAAAEWATGLGFAKAASIALSSGSGTVTSASLISALYTFRDETFGGMVPPLTFTSGAVKDVPCFFVQTITKNGLASPQALKTLCAPTLHG